MKRKFLIIGLGKSGLAIVRYLIQNNKNIVVAVDAQAKEKSFHHHNLCPIFCDDHEFSLFDFDFVILSPGISLCHSLCREAIQRKIPIMGEVEFSVQQMLEHERTMIGITGSNGKSTISMMVTHILQQSGHKVKCVGNIGIPLISVIHDDPSWMFVVELSSFQLETMKTPCFDVAVILNLFENHLDRHDNMNNYFCVKRNIGNVLKPNGLFGIQGDLVDHYNSFLRDVQYQRVDGDFVEFIADHYCVSKREVARWRETFCPLSHRLQYVGCIEGMKCYNDSKATNPAAVVYAVRQIGRSIILLLGGRKKIGTSFLQCQKDFIGRVKMMIIFGESRATIAEEVEEFGIPMYLVQTLREGIQIGLKEGTIGDNFVLSPGCASFDEFFDFKKRGEYFKEELYNESKRCGLYQRFD